MGWSSHALARPPPFSNTREGESSIERRGCGWVKERGKVVRYERTAGEESERRAASKESFLLPPFFLGLCASLKASEVFSLSSSSCFFGGGRAAKWTYNTFLLERGKIGGRPV